MTDEVIAEKSAYEQLNNKQRAFVDTYLANGFNATREATKVGYSPKTAYSIGSENLRKPEIKAAISERMAEAAMDANEVMGRLAAIARSDIGDMFTTLELDVAGATLDDEETEETPQHAKRRITVLDIEKAVKNGQSFLIKSYSTSQTGHRVEMYSAMDALQLIGKTHKLFVDRTETAHSGVVEFVVKYENAPNS